MNCWGRGVESRQVAGLCGGCKQVRIALTFPAMNLHLQKAGIMNCNGMSICDLFSRFPTP